MIHAAWVVLPKYSCNFGVASWGELRRIFPPHLREYAWNRVLGWIHLNRYGSHVNSIRLQILCAGGQISAASYVWRPGLTGWVCPSENFLFNFMFCLKKTIYYDVHCTTKALTWWSLSCHSPARILQVRLFTIGTRTLTTRFRESLYSNSASPDRLDSIATEHILSKCVTLDVHSTAKPSHISDIFWFTRAPNNHLK